MVGRTYSGYGRGSAFAKAAAKASSKQEKAAVKVSKNPVDVNRRMSSGGGGSSSQVTEQEKQEIKEAVQGVALAAPKSETKVEQPTTEKKQLPRLSITRETSTPENGSTRQTISVSQRMVPQLKPELIREGLSASENISMTERFAKESRRLKEERELRASKDIPFAYRVPLVEPLGFGEGKKSTIEKGLAGVKFGTSKLVAPVTSRLQSVAERYPRTTTFATSAIIGAGTVLVTKRLPTRVTMSSLFTTGQFAVGAGYLGTKTIEFGMASTQGTTKKFVLDTGAELGGFLFGGLAASKGKIAFTKTKDYLAPKLEQYQTNLAIEVEGGKLVTSNFFKKPNLGNVEITGDALISAKGVRTKSVTPFGLTEFNQYSPKFERVKVSFPFGKEPLPKDFLFTGTKSESILFTSFATEKPGLTRQPLFLEKQTNIAGFGFPKDLGVASTPFKSIGVSAGKPIKGAAFYTKEFEVQFSPTKLSRSQAVSPIFTSEPPSSTGGFKRTMIEFNPKELEFSYLGEQPGSFIFSEKGRFFAPEPIKLTEGLGKIGAFLDIPKPRTTQGLTSSQILKEFPVIARKVKITPTKVPKTKKGFIEIFVEKDVPTSQGLATVQLQKVLSVSEAELGLKQTTKQKTVSKQKLKQQQVSKQKLEQELGTKQGQRQEQGSILEPQTKSQLAQQFQSAQGYKQILIQRPKQKQSSIQSQLPKQRFDQALSQVPIQKQNVNQILSTKQKPIQDYKLRQDLKLETIRPPKLRTRIIREPTKKVPSLKIPSFEFGPRLKGKKKPTNIFSKGYKYKPSLVALEGKIKGKKSLLEGKPLTGLEIRKILL